MSLKPEIRFISKFFIIQIGERTSERGALPYQVTELPPKKIRQQKINLASSQAPGTHVGEKNPQH